MKIFVRLAMLAVAACLTLTACGGGGGTTPAASGSGGAPSPAATSSGSASLSAFDTCLKAHGVKVTPRAHPFPSGTARPTDRPTAFPSGHPHPSGSPGFGRGGFGNSADSAAFKACAKYAPAGFGRGGFGGGGVISASALAAFKSCMKQNGVTITGSTAQAIFTQMRTATGKTATAFKTCRPLLDLATPTSTPSPTT